MSNLNKALDKVDGFIGKIETAICGTLLTVMSLTVFLQIVCRFFKFPLVWSEELSRFMFIWLIYMSVCMATRRESHLCVDILPLLIHSEKGKIILKIISNILCICFFAFVAYYGVEVIQKLIKRPQVSAAMQLNMIWAYLGPYTGSAIACIHYVVLIIREIGELITLNKGGAEA